MTKKTSFFDIKAFTLIELMVVVGIIAILAAVGISIYANAQKIARDGKRIADLQEIQKALEQYFAVNNNAYPANANYPSSINSYFPTNAVPTDPTNTGAFVYTYNNNAACVPGGQKYVICAKMEGLTSKANSDAAMADACANFAVTAPAFFCVKSISN